MKTENIYTVDQLGGTIHFLCAACMSVYADALSWANANPPWVSKTEGGADNIVVLGCQVTDLAVLNDLRTIEFLQEKYPNKQIFAGGCLARRIDIPLPSGTKRLQVPSRDYQWIHDKTLVSFQEPFWVNNFQENDNKFKDGHLLRYQYPLRIGTGCKFNCSYCTIKTTRGPYHELNNYGLLTKEYISNSDRDVLLVGDSPTVEQIIEWCNILLREGVDPISIRNVEPQVTCACKDKLLAVAKEGLLKIYHTPIQSDNEAVLRDMGRSVEKTAECIEIAKSLRRFGTYIATNIMIDYRGFESQNFERIHDVFNYVSWNPYWNGNWDREWAEKRYKHYLST